MKKLVSLILSLALVFSLAACGGQTAQSPAPTQSPAQSDAAEGPVTIENGGRTLTFGEVPRRVVCLNMQMTEMMLMLGLGDKVIYTCYTNAEPMVQIKDAFNAIPLLSEKYPSTEVLLGAEPDLVLGQRFGFTEDKAGTVETLADHGLPAYVSEGTLASEEKIENIWARSSEWRTAPRPSSARCRTRWPRWRKRPPVWRTRSPSLSWTR